MTAVAQTPVPGSDIAFWDWSLSTYAKPDVEGRLLRLQESAKLDVNLALWCAWAGARFGALPEIAIRKAIDLTTDWNREVVVSLRAARRALKTPPRQADAGASAALRSTVKAAELEAERIQQAMLDALAVDFASQAETAAAQDAARRNLTRYARLVNAIAIKGFSVADLESTIDAIFADGAERTE